VGSEQAKRADVRIVAATNRDLAQMVAEGKFREDLYFRLSVFQIHAPPLRERRQDIPGLVRFLLQRGAKRLLEGAPILIDPEVEELLAAYEWPGNVREMENVIDRALILADDGHVTCADLPPQIAKGKRSGTSMTTTTVMTPPDSGNNLREQVRSFESALIGKAISDADGDRRIAAQKLGIGLSSLYRKLEEYETLGLLQGSPALQDDSRPA
jgi:two-component system, NtrC family, response regulator AtoC